MDEEDLIFCYNNIRFLLSIYCQTGGCSGCTYNNQGGSCFKQDLKAVLHVETDFNVKIHSIKEAYELLDMVWDNVKGSCDMGKFKCEKCIFGDSKAVCKRITIRKLMQEKGFE